MITTEVIHAIWIERNQRIFEKKNDPDRVAREIAFVSNVQATNETRPIVQSFLF